MKKKFVLFYQPAKNTTSFLILASGTSPVLSSLIFFIKYSHRNFFITILRFHGYVMTLFFHQPNNILA